jgi:hydroxymethylbilane synthase
MKIIRIGTRGSKLALAQVELVRERIAQVRPDVVIEVEIVKTAGDTMLDESLQGRIDKGFFTTEIEHAVLEKRVDIAVHSLKDLPVDMPDGLVLGAMLPRGNPLDVWISRDGRKLDAFTNKDVVATSSTRRRAQLLAANPGIQLRDIRGNVDTRVRKLHEGYCDALVLAAAGIERLGLTGHITAYLPPEIMLPAPGQAVIAVQAREDDPEITSILAGINHHDTLVAARAERLFLKYTGGGCHLPVAAYARMLDARWSMDVNVCSPDGQIQVRRQMVFDEPDLEEKTRLLAQEVMDAGGREILEKIERHAC